MGKLEATIKSEIVRLAKREMRKTSVPRVSSLAITSWGGVILCGIIIPIIISLVSYFAGELTSPLLIAGVASEMIGAFSLKYSLLKSSYYSPLIPTLK